MPQARLSTLPGPAARLYRQVVSQHTRQALLRSRARRRCMCCWLGRQLRGAAGAVTAHTRCQSGMSLCVVCPHAAHPDNEVTARVQGALPQLEQLSLRLVGQHTPACVHTPAPTHSMLKQAHTLKHAKHGCFGVCPAVTLTNLPSWSGYRRGKDVENQYRMS